MTLIKFLLPPSYSPLNLNEKFFCFRAAASEAFRAWFCEGKSECRDAGMLRRWSEAMPVPVGNKKAASASLF